MKGNIFPIFGVILFANIGKSTQQNLITEGTDLDKLVEEALHHAKEIMEKDRLMSNRSSRMSSTPSNFKHTYVKFSPLTEAIGESSNDNLIAFNILLQNGVDRDAAIDQLFTRRHDFCTERLMRCNSTAKYRTANGTCNNLLNPMWGASFTQFNRIIPNYYPDAINLPVGGDGKKVGLYLPNTRQISRTLHGDLIKAHTRVTNMLPQFGQFVDHDISLTPEEDKRCCSGVQHVDCFNININTNDTFYSKLLDPQRCMDFTRSTPFCFPTVSGIREQMNIITAYVDASNVYGSENERSFLVRSFFQGKLRTNQNNPNYPPSKVELERITMKEVLFMGTFVGGDARINETPGLLTMHSLWLREHNRIAKIIQEKRPDWSDEQIYQETRRIVIAQMQNIVYGEYLTVLLGTTAMNRYGLTLDDQFSFYDASVDATIFNSFATAAYRFGHTFINGLVQLMKGLTNIGSYRIRDNFFLANQMTQDGGKGYDYILGGLMIQNAQNFDPFVTEDLTNFVLRNPTEEFGADLIARNLQRGRDHGLQPFMSYRRHCGLKTSSSWNNRPTDIREDSWASLQTLYSSPQDIELFSGGLVEIPPKGALTGATFNCLKAMQFQKLKKGDRHFFTHGAQAGSFKMEQLSHLLSRNFGDVICENSGVEQTPKNVFIIRSRSNTLLPCNSTERVPLDIDLLLM